MSQGPYVFLLLHTPPQLSGRCRGKPPCLLGSVSLPLCVSLWGWLSPCASDSIQGSVQMSPLRSFQTCTLPRIWTTLPSTFSLRTQDSSAQGQLRFPEPLALAVEKAPRQPCLGYQTSAHTSPETGNPLSLPVWALCWVALREARPSWH